MSVQKNLFGLMVSRSRSVVRRTLGLFHPGDFDGDFSVHNPTSHALICLLLLVNSLLNHLHPSRTHSRNLQALRARLANAFYIPKRPKFPLGNVFPTIPTKRQSTLRDCLTNIEVRYTAELVSQICNSNNSRTLPGR